MRRFVNFCHLFRLAEKDQMAAGMVVALIMALADQCKVHQ